jgi:2-methylcitrate dehydratase PrpD
VDATDRIVDLAWATQYEELSSAAVRATKRVVLDTIACAVPGMAEQSGAIVRDVYGSVGGAPESTLLGTASRVPVLNAVYVNSHAANVLDGDDIVRWKGHVAAATVPTGLAFAERQRSTGRALILAVALGYEAATRAGLSMRGLILGPDGSPQFSPLSTHSWTGIGSCVTAGRLLGLDPAGIRNAIGITGSTLPLPASTAFGSSLPRPMTKYVMYGPTAQAGAAAALLAERGFTGEPQILDGDTGLWRMLGSLDCDYSWMTGGYDGKFLIEDACFKPYPACRFNNVALDVFLGLLDHHRIAPDDIASVEVQVPGPGLEKHRAGEPEVGSLVDASFSLPHLIAAAALAGPPGPRWLSEATRSDPRVRDLARRTTVRPHPQAAEMAGEDMKAFGYLTRMPSTVTIHLRDTAVSGSAVYAKGDVFDPAMEFSDADFAAKLENFAGELLSRDQIDRAVEFVLDLENQESIAPLATSLVSQRSLARA